MTSYNRINGVFSSENKRLITDILRGEWGFDGIVMSDWGGTFSTAARGCAPAKISKCRATRLSVYKEESATPLPTVRLTKKTSTAVLNG